MSDPLLMIPGPTILPPEVREALSRPSIYHRGEGFATLLEECTEGLRTLFDTSQSPLILSASGTGGVEAALVNTLSPGDRVLAVNSGKFGERMGQIASTYGAAVDCVPVEPGCAAHPDAVGEALAKTKYQALLFVLNETSTGVKQNGAALAAVAREAGTLTIVDCVSAIAGMPISFDRNGYTATGAGSQKALMLPPGLAFAVLSEEGLQAAQTARMPRFYFDLPKALKALEKGQTPYTPNVNMILALRASLRLIQAEGLAQLQERHRRMARACRTAARVAGLELLASEADASDVVTAIKAPACVDSSELVKRLRDRHDILISGGQDALKGKIFRIGHLGAARLDDLLRTWEATATELTGLGHECDVPGCLQACGEAYEA